MPRDWIGWVVFLAQSAAAAAFMYALIWGMTLFGVAVTG